MDDSIDSQAATVRFYARHASIYDVLARAPFATRYRRRLIESLPIESGDTVLDVGTGTGRNLGLLREAVGPTGTVVGIDITRPLLTYARSETDAAIVEGDMTRLPFEPTFDAIIGSFVTGMVTDPGRVVSHWVDHLDDDGSIGVLDVAPRRSGSGIADELLRIGVRLGATPNVTGRYGRPPATVLYERVNVAHDAVLETTATGRREEYGRGFVHLAIGRL